MCLKATNLMNDDLRARLAAARLRNQAAQHIAERQAYAGAVPILSALESAGEPYSSDSYRCLAGALNLWAHDPAMHGMRMERRQDLPEDISARRSAITAALRERLVDIDIVTAIIRWEQLVVCCQLAVLLKHMDALLETAEGGELGLAAPGSDWIITVLRRRSPDVNKLLIGWLE